MKRRTENFWRLVSGWMPKRLVYFCAVRLGVHATVGEYRHQIVPELTFMDALGRYESEVYR